MRIHAQARSRSARTTRPDCAGINQDETPPMNPMPSQTRENRKLRRRRLVPFLLNSCAGVVAGISGDLLGPERFDAFDFLSSIPLWPIAVTLGGWHVTIPWANRIFLVGGLAFLPVYIFLLVLCLRKPSSSRYICVSLWCAQGFFQLYHRVLPFMAA